MAKKITRNIFGDRGDEKYPIQQAIFIISLSALIFSYFTYMLFSKDFDIASFMQYNAPVSSPWLLLGLFLFYLAGFTAVLFWDKERKSVLGHHIFSLLMAGYLFINATKNQWFEYENALYIVSGCLFLALYAGYLLEKLKYRFDAAVMFMEKNAAVTAAAACILYFAYFSWLGLERHALCYSQMWDMAWEHQVLHNLAQTGVPYSTIESLSGRVNWGDHASFIYYLLVPFYKIFPDAGFLIITQALAVAAAGFLVYIFSSRVLKNRLTGLVLAIVFIMHPSVQGYLLEDFHPNVLALPAFFAMLIFAEKKNFTGTLISLVLLALTREDMAFFSVFIALFLPAANKSGGLKRGIGLLAASAAAAVTALLVMKITGGGLTDASRFYALSGSFTGVLQALILNPVYIFSQCFHPDKIQFLVIVSVPLLFLFYGYKPVWILLVPAFIFGIFSQYYPHFLPGYHYSVMFVCAAFAGAVYYMAGAKKSARISVAGTMVVLAFLMNYYYGNVFPKSYRMITTEVKQALYTPDYNCRDWTGHYRQIKGTKDTAALRIMKSIPEKYRVSADHFAAAHVSGRRYLYQIQHYEAADIVIARPGKDTYPGFRKLITTQLWEFNVREQLLADGSISLTAEGEVAFK
ncbi:MAG: DUF2079 domain-containing protein [Spirochaetia bacterium]|nr:DUF2079 domain-containing protein [Spirochaetia bacterium]